MSASTPLLTMVRDYIESDPASAARTLEAMSEGEAAAVTQLLRRDLKARVIPHLQISFAAGLLKGVTEKDFEAVAGAMQPERAAAVFSHLPEDAQQRFLPHLGDKVRRHARELLAYPEDSVGRIMTPQFLALRNTLKARDAVRKIRSLSKDGMPVSYAYVVDGDDSLVGVLNMHGLLLAPPDASLESLMRSPVFSLRPFVAR